METAVPPASPPGPAAYLAGARDRLAFLAGGERTYAFRSATLPLPPSCLPPVCHCPPVQPPDRRIFLPLLRR